MVYDMENPIKMDDLGVPLFLETPIFLYVRCWQLGLSYFMIQKDLPHVFPHSQVKQRHLSQTISSFPPFFPTLSWSKNISSQVTQVSRSCLEDGLLVTKSPWDVVKHLPTRSALDIEVLWSSTKMDLHWLRWQRQKSWQTTHGQVKYSKYVH